MPVLRELVSRFSFETDKKSVKQFDSTIGRMKKSVLGLGAALGLSVGGKALFGMGVSAAQAEQNLKRLAGTDLENLNNHMFVMKQRIDNIKSGASNLLRDKTVNVLAASFIKDFGSANKEIQTFTTLLESATLQSAITGTSIEEIFTGLVGAIKSNDFSALVGLGGFDVAQQKLTEDVVAAKDPKEIGGQFGRDIRTQALLKVISANIQEQRKQAAAASRELVDLQIAKKSITDTSEKAAETATIAGIKATAAVIREAANTERLQKEGKDANAFDTVINSFFNLFKQGTDGIKSRRGITEQSNIEINMPTTIEVNEATDAKGVVDLIQKEDARRLGEAKRQIIRSEDKK